MKTFFGIRRKRNRLLLVLNNGLKAIEIRDQQEDGAMTSRIDVADTVRLATDIDQWGKPLFLAVGICRDFKTHTQSERRERERERERERLMVRGEYPLEIYPRRKPPNCNLPEMNPRLFR